MVAHSKSVRSLKEYPRTISKHVVDATILVEGISSQVVKCTARQEFTKGNVTVAAGQEFFLVRSASFETRYYVVAWNEERHGWQCSCGANCKTHAHTTAVKDWIVKYVVKPRVAAIEATPEEQPVPGAGWLARHEEGERKQSELSRKNKEQFNADLRRIKAEQEEQLRKDEAFFMELAQGKTSSEKMDAQETSEFFASLSQEVA
jgi:hypothetical protein